MATILYRDTDNGVETQRFETRDSKQLKRMRDSIEHGGWRFTESPETVETVEVVETEGSDELELLRAQAKEAGITLRGNQSVESIKKKLSKVNEQSAQIHDEG